MDNSQTAAENTDAELDRFIETIVRDKHYATTSDEVKAQIKEDMKRELLYQIDRSVISQLTTKQINKFGDLCDNPNTKPEDIQNFIASSGVDTRRIAIQTMLKFGQYYLGVDA